MHWCLNSFKGHYSNQNLINGLARYWHRFSVQQVHRVSGFHCGHHKQQAIIVSNKHECNVLIGTVNKGHECGAVIKLKKEEILLISVKWIS